MIIDNQVKRLGSPQVLIYKPLIAKRLSRELRVVVDTGPLTIIQVKTAKGKVAYMFKARNRRYADKAQLATIINKVMRHVYYNPEKDRIKSRRYWSRHKDERNAKRRKSSQ